MLWNTTKCRTYWNKHGDRQPICKFFTHGLPEYTWKMTSLAVPFDGWIPSSQYPKIAWCHWGEIEPFFFSPAQDRLAESGKNPLKYRVTAGNWTGPMEKTDLEKHSFILQLSYRDYCIINRWTVCMTPACRVFLRDFDLTLLKTTQIFQILRSTPSSKPNHVLLRASCNFWLLFIPRRLAYLFFRGVGAMVLGFQLHHHTYHNWGILSMVVHLYGSLFKLDTWHIPRRTFFT